MASSSQKISHPSEITPVLIVGGSLIGLSAAVFLARLGVPSLLVEQYSGSPFPRAGNFNTRTMELFRMAGIEEAIRREEVLAVQGGGFLYAESLAGKEISWITDFFSEEGEGSVSIPPPIRRSNIGQSQLEGILQTHARALGADIRFNTEFLSWITDAEGITAAVRDKLSGNEYTIRSHYLIAADGNRSPIRQQLRIAIDGPGTLSLIG